jgi:CRISPR-associated protein Cmr2
VSFDLYAELAGSSNRDVDEIVKGSLHGTVIPNPAARVQLLTGVAAANGLIKEYVLAGDRKKGGGYKSLVHSKRVRDTEYARSVIQESLRQLGSLGLIAPSMPLHNLPPGSWFLQFEFKLAKPWLSKDEDPFYVTDAVNPVRKDKVFKIPVMAGSSWKGLLRWAVTQVHLVDKRNELSAEEFAQRRLAHTLLFGDEKGEGPEGAKEFARFLDDLKSDAQTLYRQNVRKHFNLSDDKGLPHHSGRLMCYPTFFDLIDLEVINPHSRKTRAGTLPIYLECVPAGAKGTFSLLYVPVDLIGQPSERVGEQAKMDLQTVCTAITALMLTYGFSAKRTSGFGAAEDAISGQVRTACGKRTLTQLSNLGQEVRSATF